MSVAITMHPFEAAGLGQAPFVCVGLEECWFPLGNGARKPGGTCDYCSNGIAYKFAIQSRDGKRFHVGCDCVRKLSRTDNRLLSQVERIKAKHDAAKRDAKRKAEWAAKCEARDAALQAQRDRNGGLTDAEVRQAEEKAAAAAKADEFRAINGWILDVLDQIDGFGFVASMRDALAVKPFTSLSPRQLDVLCDIYAKHHGRNGSKANETARIEFQSKLAN